MTSDSTGGAIELSDMIRYLKSELATARTRSGDGFELTLDECAFELNVAVKRDGTAGIKVYVVSVGGGLSLEQTHKVSAKFKPAAAGDPGDHVFETGSGASQSEVTVGSAKSKRT